MNETPETPMIERDETAGPASTSSGGLCVPAGTDGMEVRVTRLVVAPPGEPIYSERATIIEIDDEAAGEYVTLQQDGGHVKLEKRVAFDADEWPVIEAAVRFMLAQCRDT